MQDNSPAWLKSPPCGDFPAPPVDTRAQTLPFGELTWENFEKLVRRLVSREATIADCWIYGVRGQAQHGIDILASRHKTSNEFVCYQCKRVKEFSADDIQKAVDAFLVGKWADKAKTFVLCTSSTLNNTKQVDEIIAQRARLADRGIGFEVWDGSEGGYLSERLKELPELVDDFFLREWVRRFNGEDAAEQLGERLDGADLAALRAELGSVYATLFRRHDQGLRLGSQRAVELLDRYVAPTIIENRIIMATVREPDVNATNPEESQRSEMQPRSSSTIRSNSIQDIPTSVDEWLSRHDKTVILGEPGYGKSALLRVIAMQLINDRDGPFRLPWNGLLPVWVSFGGFSTAIQEQPGLSIEDYFDQWLHQNSAEAARPLFQRSIKKGEMLLLVDGLDEGQTESASKQAMDRISAFLSIRPVPAVFTSRPRGYERIRPDGTWPTGRLGAFDEEQIRHFSKIWFEYLETPVFGTQAGEEDNSNAERRTSDFLKAIRANPRVMELAQTPLFCQLLIDIFRYSHHLPEQRVKVYDEIVKMLLSDHPAAREQAAGLTKGNDAPRAADMREMLMRLALHIQEEGGAGVISATDCQDTFYAFLTDDLNGPGLSPYEARHQAQSIVAYAQTGLGLIVERAPNELGFFHLTIQEYLAAQAMVRKDEETQLAWLIRVWDQAKWHEVVLAWFSIRGTDQGKEATQRAIEHLKNATMTPWARLQLLTLRTELAANEYGLSPREARITIKEAADAVETSPFPELRQALARQIALGLRAPSVSDTCKSRIANWIPAHPEWRRRRLLDVLGNWRASDDLLHTLKLALHDEDVMCRRAAAESLARAFGRDSATGDYLAHIASHFPDTGVRAAAIHSLWKGWPNRLDLDNLADLARRSKDMDLALTGIAIRVSKGLHDAEDRRLIWEMFNNGNTSYELRDTCRKVLVQGWRNDGEFKRIALEVLHDSVNFTFPERERAASFLIHAQPGDKEVARCVAQFYETTPNYFFLHHDESLGKAIFSGFRGDPDISRAIRAALLERRSKYEAIYWGPNSKWAYCLLGDETAKAELLEAYSLVRNSREKYWICSTLMEAWSGDGEVRETLEKEYLKQPETVPFLANWVDSFIQEPNGRRTWLLDAIGSDDLREVRGPVGRLLDEFRDDECLVAVKSIVTTDIWYYDKINFQGRLIEAFPNNPEVRGWLEPAFENIDGPSIASIAKSHEQDQVIRPRLLAAAAPAKADVRAEVFRVFREYPVSAPIVFELTKNIWAECDATIRTSGVLARCMATEHSPEHKPTLASKLHEELDSLGTYLESRRRSALCGLLQLGDFEACVDALTKKNSSSAYWVADYHNADSLTARTFFEHWNELQEASQAAGRSFETPWGGLIDNGTAREALINTSARIQLIAYLKALPVQDRTPEGISLMAELLPCSAELRVWLIETITTSERSFRHNDIIFEAQRIYAEQFGGDQQALDELRNFGVTNVLPRPPRRFPSFLYALALGWPNDPELHPWLQQEKFPQLPIPVVLALCKINGNEEAALACIDKIIEVTLKHGRLLSATYMQGLRKWALLPSAESLLKRLMSDSDCSRSIMATRLLSDTGKLNNVDRLNMIQKFNESFGDAAIPSPDGVDLIDGRVNTFPQAILSILFNSAA